MKKHIFITLAVASGVLLSVTAFPQDVAIDYTKWSPSSPPCNIFGEAINVPATVDGASSTILHLTTIGQPQLNTSPKEIRLACQYVNASSSLGTKYRIEYSFKAGYRYYITVNAAQLNSTTGTAEGVSLRLDMTNNGSGGTTACGGAQSISPNLSGNPSPFTFTDAAFDDRVFPYSSPLSSSYSTLEISAIPAQVSGSDNTIRIKNITIEETPPDISFTLAPATLNITCGSSTPQTFTVTNVHSTPGVTAYHWSLGSSPNGWIYNGNPAPATIQTSANTLTLTPACQLTHSDISVSVTAGGNNYPGANTAAITGSSPSYTLTGDDIICSGNKSYALNTLPCGSSVSWTSSKPGLASVSASGNPAILTRNGSGSGTVTLTGTISGSCGSSSISKTITVGAPASSSLYADWDTPIKIIAGADEVVNATAYKWYVDNVYIKSTSYYNTSLPYYGSCSTNVIVAVEAVTSCGTSSKTSTNIGTPPCSYFMITPNPAQESISIMPDGKSGMAAKAGQPATVRDNLRQVKIIDGNGSVVKTRQWATPVREANISVAELAPGLYFVEITGERGWYTQKLVITR